MKKIVVIKAHPRKNSFCSALADEYTKGAENSGNEVKVLKLRELNLEEFIKFGHSDIPELPEDLKGAQRLILWADHLVFVHPIWWAVPPALLKVFIEIVFLSGFAFKYQSPNGSIPKWDKLFSEKSARLIATMDSPPLYYRFVLGDPGFKMMKANLNFCGITPVKKNYFGSIKMSSEEKKKQWLEKAYQIGFKE